MGGGHLCALTYYPSWSRDDGVGFTPPEQPADLAHQGHFGLMGMRERVLLYGGQLTITSSPGQGATITARLPLLP